jgi:hypothetical protein
MAPPDPLAQRVVAPLPQRRDRVQRRRPVDQGVPKPVRDDAQVSALALTLAGVASLLMWPVGTAPM